MKRSLFLISIVCIIACIMLSCNSNNPTQEKQTTELTNRHSIGQMNALNLALDDIESSYPIEPGDSGRSLPQWVKWLLIVLADIGGGILGTLANGGIGGGIAIGAICSLSTAVKLPVSSNILTSNNDNILLFNQTDPIYADVRYVELLPSNIVGSNAGYYHNACIIDYLNENNFEDFSEYDMYEYLQDNMAIISNNTIQNYANYSDTIEEKSIGIYNFSYNMANGMLSDADSVFDSLDNIYDEFQIIRRYIEFSTELMTVEDFHNYTVSFMTTIQTAGQNNILTSDEVEAINSGISIYYYSRHLWKTTIPDPRLNSTYLALNTGTNNWDLYIDISSANMAVQCALNNYSIIGIPTFANENVDKIYFYKNLLYLDNASILNSIISQGYLPAPPITQINTFPNNRINQNRSNGQSVLYYVRTIDDTDIAFIDFNEFSDD